MNKFFFSNKRIRKIFLFGFLLLPIVAFAQVMESSNYKIQSDSINFGGALSDSTNFSLEDTLGEVATGISSSSNYSISAGYQAMVNSYVSISSPSDISLSSIGGLSGGESNGSAIWTVTTSNPNGYVLYVKASTNPALKSVDSSFDDYVTVGGDPDFNFTISSSESAFGFSPEGNDIVDRFRDNGAICNTSSSDTTDSCWDKFSTSDTLIASSDSANTPSGETTTVKVKAKIGSARNQDEGSYTATITATALAF